LCAPGPFSGDGNISRPPFAGLGPGLHARGPGLQNAPIRLGAALFVPEISTFWSRLQGPGSRVQHHRTATARVSASYGGDVVVAAREADSLSLYRSLSLHIYIYIYIYIYNSIGALSLSISLFLSLFLCLQLAQCTPARDFANLNSSGETYFLWKENMFRIWQQKNTTQLGLASNSTAPPRTCPSAHLLPFFFIALKPRVE